MFFFDVGQNCAQVFVLGDRSMRDTLLMRVEDAAGQGNAFGADLDAPIRHLVDIHVFANQTASQIVDLKPNALAVVLQRQILSDIALVAQAKDFREAIWLDV